MNKKEEAYSPWLFRTVLGKELRFHGAHYRALDVFLANMEGGLVRTSAETIATAAGLSLSSFYRVHRDLLEGRVIKRVDLRGWIVDPQMYWQGSKRELRRLKARFDTRED